MKKFLYTIFISAFAVFFVACAKVDEKAVSLTSETGLAITGSIMNFDDTRVAYSLAGDALKSSWVEGDRIFGFDNTGATFTFEVESIEGSKAKFRIVVPPASDAEKLYAIYYPGKTSFDFEKDENSLKLLVDVSSQSGKLDGTTPAIMCAMGQIENNTVEFEFSNQMAIVGITQMQLCESKDTPISQSTTITGVTLNNVATTGTIKIDDNVFKLVQNDNQGCISATGLNLSTVDNGFVEIPQNELAPYFAVVPTMEESTENDPISVTATDGTKTYHNLVNIKATSLEAGQYYYLGKKLDKIVAICDGRGYTDLEKAFEYAANAYKDVTIKMYNNVTLTSDINFTNNNNGKITLDLNGFYIDASAVSTAFYGATSFEVKDDNEPSKQGTVRAQTCAIHLKPVSNSQTLTIKGGKFEASGCSNGSTGVIYFQNNNMTSCRLYVQGGEITCTNENGRAVNVSCSSTLSGGKIESKGIGWRCNGGTTTIDGTAVIISESKSPIQVTSTYKVDFVDGYASASESHTIFDGAGNCNITGGHFNKEVTSADGLEEGYICYRKGEPSGYEYIVESEAGEALFEYTEGGQTYKTNAKLVDAITMANEYKGECTITMLKDYTLVSKQTITNPYGVTLDLNGWTITHDGTKRIGVSGSGNLTITDTKTGGSGKITQKTPSSSTITYSSGSLTIAGGTITKASGSTYNTINVSGGKLTVTGGTITNDAKQGTNYLTTATIYASAGKVTISNGEVSSSAANAIAISGGELEVTGGQINATGSAGNALYLGEGSTTIKISGGALSSNAKVAVNMTGKSAHKLEFSGDCSVSSTSSNALYSSSTATEPRKSYVTVTGGCFKSGEDKAVFSVDDNSVVTKYAVSNCIFSGKDIDFSLSRYDPIGVQVVNDDPNTNKEYPKKVVPKVVLTVGSGDPQPFATVEEAVTEANKHSSECTITLNADYQMVNNASVENSQGVTLDLNNCTLTQKATDARITPKGTGKLIITDSGTNGKITQTSKQSSTFTFDSGELIINKGTITKPTVSAGNTITVKGGTLTVNGGSITNDATQGTSIKAMATIAVSGGNVNVNDGSISSNGSCTIVFYSADGQLIVSGGEIEAKGQEQGNALYFSAGTIIITNGYIHSIKAAININGTEKNTLSISCEGQNNTRIISQNSNAIYSSSTATNSRVNITSGYFSCGTSDNIPILSNADGSVKTVWNATGGYFSKSTSRYAQGYGCINTSEVSGYPWHIVPINQ